MPRATAGHSSAGDDVTAPVLPARAPRRQRVLRHRGAVVYVRCNERCTRERRRHAARPAPQVRLRAVRAQLAARARGSGWSSIWRAARAAPRCGGRSGATATRASCCGCGPATPPATGQRWSGAACASGASRRSRKRALDRVRRELERAPVGGRRLLVPAEPAQQAAARGVEVLVVVELAARAPARRAAAARARAVRHGHGHRAVERHHRGRRRLLAAARTGSAMRAQSVACRGARACSAAICGLDRVGRRRAGARRQREALLRPRRACQRERSWSSSSTMLAALVHAARRGASGGAASARAARAPRARRASGPPARAPSRIASSQSSRRTSVSRARREVALVEDQVERRPAPARAARAAASSAGTSYGMPAVADLALGADEPLLPWPSRPSGTRARSRASRARRGCAA